ncbi:MAG TPA: hypothetical protein VJA21_29245 [Verrucomicrobiae bacterium]
MQQPDLAAEAEQLRRRIHREWLSGTRQHEAIRKTNSLVRHRGCLIGLMAEKTLLLAQLKDRLVLMHESTRQQPKNDG